MKKLLLFIGLLAPSWMFSQGRLVLGTTAAYIVETGGTAANPAYIVIHNPSSTAITMLSTTNDWIISESEFNMVKWDIGNSTGTYVVPFGDSTARYYLPVTLDIGAAGNSGGSVKFSTWQTVPDNWTGTVSINGPPSDVTNMHPATSSSSPTPTDNSYNVVDRFWVLDTKTYTTVPTPTGNGITFSYIRRGLGTTAGGNNEIVSPNVFTEADLFAQRFNSTASTWGGFGGQGGTVSTTASVGSAYSGPVSPANFFRSWTLTNSIEPLPIQITSFTAQCDNGAAMIQWRTATEINNHFYTVEKTVDNVHFFTVATVQGAGNSSFPITYPAVYDNSPYPGVSYYFLYQTDFDGDTNLAGKIQFNGCAGAVNNTTTVTAFNAGPYIDVQINPLESGNCEISLLTMLGQTVLNQTVLVAQGINNEFRLDNVFSAGIYLLNVKNNQGSYTKKLVIER